MRRDGWRYFAFDPMRFCSGVGGDGLLFFRLAKGKFCIIARRSGNNGPRVLQKSIAEWRPKSSHRSAGTRFAAYCKTLSQKLSDVFPASCCLSITSWANPHGWLVGYAETGPKQLLGSSASPPVGWSTRTLKAVGALSPSVAYFRPKRRKDARVSGRRLADFSDTWPGGIAN